ncbi:hypothetical protein [Streptacidiphilus sp. MAP5-52]|uniref:hypothetical protein n=1 Tax=Streptacidiphilus sp. MAP5-52 TaxID=3156267 RepID=UPI0035146A85
MTVQIVFDVTHSCGHEVSTDLSDRPADRRAGFARWLSTRQCTDCWRRDRETDQSERAAWLVAKRAQEQADASAWAEQYAMPPLDGPAKAVPWGERVRHQLVSDAYTALVVEGDLSEEQWQSIEDQARTIDRASWWIDQREADAADLPELLEAATDADRVTENPY